MGNFYIRRSANERFHKDHDKDGKEDWFFDEKYYTKTLSFVDRLPDNKMVLRRWCQNNLEGDVAVEYGIKRYDGYSKYMWTFWFELETDAMAFKIKWM